jgi:plastocyanin
MRTLVFVVACSLFLFTASDPSRAQARSASAGSESNTISIDNFTFDAATVTVAAGTQVTWVNHDDVPHKIVSTEKRFSSAVLDTDGRFSYTFTTPGTYEYFCSIHPMMKGKVIVR